MIGGAGKIEYGRYLFERGVVPGTHSGQVLCHCQRQTTAFGVLGGGYGSKTG
jgi:hypothetical protein